MFNNGDTLGTPRAFTISFSPDNDELFFSKSLEVKKKDDPNYHIMYMKRINNEWTAPKLAFFSGSKEFADVDITFSPLGDMVFFASSRPHSKTSDADIYYIKKSSEGWSQPVHAGLEVNTIHNEVYPSLSKKGHLFFASNRPGGYGNKDIYKAEYKNGRFTNVTNMGDIINTENLESDCCVAPDESYLLFNTIRPENNNKINIYVSFQKENGTWTKAVRLAEPINAKGENTAFAIITHDGKYLFYSARRGKERGVYWISTEVIKKQRAKILN